MNILMNYGCYLRKLSLPQPWGWSHPCPGCGAKATGARQQCQPVGLVRRAWDADEQDIAEPLVFQSQLHGGIWMQNYTFRCFALKKSAPLKSC